MAQVVKLKHIFSARSTQGQIEKAQDEDAKLEERINVPWPWMQFDNLT